MKTTLKFEELLMFILGILAFNQLNFAWWWFLVFFLVPDISMLGYVVDPKIGAITYNLFHHKGIAILLYVLGVFLKMEIIELIGVILFSHSSFDRILGYGLKYSTSFHDTHLGKIGNK